MEKNLGAGRKERRSSHPPAARSNTVQCVQFQKERQGKWVIFATDAQPAGKGAQGRKPGSEPNSLNPTAKTPTQPHRAPKLFVHNV